MTHPALQHRDMVTEIREHEGLAEIFRDFTDIDLIARLYKLERLYGSWEKVREVLCLDD